ITAGPAGNFTFNSPAISPSTWLMAMTTDGDGNSSEFSPAERVGAGAVQCGNQALVPGWNFAGYFGQPMALGDDFPGPAVRAVHRLGNGTTNYLSWFTSGSIGLGSLTTGEPYWFYADAAMPLPG